MSDNTVLQRPQAAYIANPTTSYDSMMSEDFEKEKGFGAISIVRSVSSFDDSDDSRPTTAAGVDLQTMVDNPFDWSTGKKVFHLVVPSVMSLVTTLISSAYVAGVQPMMIDLQVSFEVSLVGYIMYILGLGIGATAWGPISEVYGRKIVYIVSMPLCAIFVMFTGISHNITGVILSRLFAGIFGIGPISAAPGTITDIYCKEQMALPSAVFVLTPFLGPAFGPVLAAYVVPWKNWRWLCWIEIAMIGAAWLPSFAMHETNATTIRRRHAAKSGLPPPPSPTAGKPASAVVMHYLNITLFLPLRMLVTESVVFCFSLYMAFNFALLYSFFAAFDYVWLHYYHFTEHSIGLTFLGIAIGCLLGLIFLVILAVTHTKPHLAKHAGTAIAPEFRLLPAMIGGCLMPASLFLYAWACYHRIHWAVPVLAEAMFACGNFLVFMSVIVYFSDIYTPMGLVASALAASTLLRYVLASAFPLFSVQMFEKLGVQWAGTLLGFLSLGLATLPFVFYVAGPRLRARSAYLMRGQVGVVEEVEERVGEAI